MSKEVTREEMLAWLDGAENDIYDYVDEGRMLDAIRALIEKVGKWQDWARRISPTDETWSAEAMVDFILEVRDFGKEEK